MSFIFKIATSFNFSPCSFLTDNSSEDKLYYLSHYSCFPVFFTFPDLSFVVLGEISIYYTKGVISGFY